VVFVSSLAALGPAPSVAAYAAAKAFTASFAASLRRYGTLPLSLPSLSLPYPP
jgi:NADP-dependent 3-hydroxy acid dehydrogenase YdfG